MEVYALEEPDGRFVSLIDYSMELPGLGVGGDDISVSRTGTGLEVYALLPFTMFLPTSNYILFSSANTNFKPP